MHSALLKIFHQILTNLMKIVEKRVIFGQIYSNPASNSRQIGEQSLSKIATISIRQNVNIVLTFANFRTVVVADERQMSKGRMLPAKRFVQKDMLGRGRLPLETSQNVRNSHQMIVDDIGKMIRGKFVRFNYDEIAFDFVRPTLVQTARHVRERHLSVVEFKSNYVRLILRQILLDFSGTQMTTFAVVALFGLSLGSVFAQQLQPCFIAKTNIRLFNQIFQ